MFEKNAHLLIDGKMAFPEIIKCINEAKKNILINIFIWRADEIGIKIAEAILEAANRGVLVTISVDRYGFVLEEAEESMRSFFHDQKTLVEAYKVAMLRFFYPDLHDEPGNFKYKDLVNEITRHPNIQVDEKTFKADHSKYYIFDDEILIMGGINIEDKENGQDLRGYKYQDYMVKFIGEEVVQNFKAALKNKENETAFYFNLKSQKRFDVESLYLKIIDEAEKEIVIVMAYFSPLKSIMSALEKACKRGVKIKVLLPKAANFQNNLNYKTASLLLKMGEVYLSDKMLHTKMIFNEKRGTLGSFNITKKAIHQLDELNYVFRMSDTKLVEDLKGDVSLNFMQSRKIKEVKELKHNRVVAFLEGFFV